MTQELKVGDRVKCIYGRPSLASYHGRLARVVKLDISGLEVEWEDNFGSPTRWTYQSSFELISRPNACPQCFQVH